MTEIGLGHYLTLAAIIFAVGVVGIFLNRKNVIIILMSIELILVAVNINLGCSTPTVIMMGIIDSLIIIVILKACTNL